MAVCVGTGVGERLYPVTLYTFWILNHVAILPIQKCKCILQNKCTLQNKNLAYLQWQIIELEKILVLEIVKA